MGVALVAEGNRGIGLGITRQLLADGLAVSILATREEPHRAADEFREIGDARYTRGSIAEPVDHSRRLADARDARGRLDVLVNNAGIGPTVREELLDATIDSFDRVRAFNLRGPGLLTQAFAWAVMGHGPDAAAELNLPDASRFTPDGGALDAQVQEVALVPVPGPVGQVEATWRPVRPIPADDGFFENVWREFRTDGETR